MADMKKSLATLFDDLAALNPPRRREVPEEVRTVAETFAEVLRVGMTDDEILAYYRHRYPYISRISAVFGQSCSGPRTHRAMVATNVIQVGSTPRRKQIYKITYPNGKRAWI